MPCTVSQLVGRIRALVESDRALGDVWVEGEISNFSRASSGHCYFTIKDAGAELRGVMWRNTAHALRTLPRDGDHVLVHGYVGVYEQRGAIQLYVDHVEAAGAGRLYQEFERLKARLEAEGLFAPERKRPLPPFPHRIGIVTSPTAAALRDVLTVLSRRYPLAGVLLAPTRVQGEQAPPEIVDALVRLNERADVDVIIVARGGGSIEELWAFNDERVVRAIAGSRIPVICGVGHETDFSLADFAADLRAPTPSAAAELATPNLEDLRAQVTRLQSHLAGQMQVALDDRRWALDQKVQALKLLSPQTQLVQARQRIDEWTGRATLALLHALRLRRERLAGLTGRLEGVSPLATLQRGYAIVRRRADEDVVTCVSHVAPGDALRIQVSDGTFDATVAE
ncbi:MAG: exodeoxyribonuclease VII large subunit [Anaerolineae bacterium]|nr:exodeoxyribonuclease VII large subunit [Anaerolineae bacterium]